VTIEITIADRENKNVIPLLESISIGVSLDKISLLYENQISQNVISYIFIMFLEVISVNIKLLIAL
jgi:hypothetical protein